MHTVSTLLSRARDAFWTNKKTAIGAATALALALPLAISAPGLAPAQTGGTPLTTAFSPEQKQAIEQIIKEYLVANPEVFMEVQQALEAKMEAAQAEKMKVAIKEHATQIYRQPSAPVAGNQKGDVTIVEFFDYNCGYCKRGFTDLAKVLERDTKVKLVLKELPILSKGSEEASKVALAAKAQGKYWEVHRALLETRAQANEAVALKIAEKAGLDMARLKKDMESAEVKAEIARVRELAQKMGIQGTPHFLVGDQSIAGAPDNLGQVLGGLVADVRKTGCQVC